MQKRIIYGKMIIGSDSMAKTVVIEAEQNKKLHNYLIVISLFVVCIVVVLYLCELYKVEKEAEQKIPIIRDSLSEIFPDDLEHYVLDNPRSFIYMCAANNEDCRIFEKSFKKLLKKNDYHDEIVYLNLTDLDQKEFVAKFNEKYPYRSGIKDNYPIFALFEDGKVKSLLQGTKDKKMTISKVKTFLELNDIGE